MERLLAFTAVLLFAAAASAQTSGTLSRTTVKSDRFDFGAGGTVVIGGSPEGSVTVEGWANPEVEITAEIEVKASNDADLERLAKVVGFTTDQSTGRVTFTSVGPNDKKYLRTVDKKFPKALMNSPYRIDYKLKVPRYCDLQIDGGKGELKINGIDGTIKVNYIETQATLDLLGGATQAVFGKGSVAVSIPSRSWRGRFVDIQLASGDLSIDLPAGLNSEFDATILKTGKIDNTFGEFKPRVRNQPFTEKSISAKSGAGGIPLKFSVSDGTITIRSLEKRSTQ